MHAYELTFPDGFDELAWEYEAKGWMAGLVLRAGGHDYALTVYDPVRLGQDIAVVLDDARVFFEPNLVVVPSVTRECIERAVEYLLRCDPAKMLVPLRPGA